MSDLGRRSLYGGTEATGPAGDPAGRWCPRALEPVGGQPQSPDTGRARTQLVDLWHLLEKLGSAARLIYGEAQAGTVLQGWRLQLLNRSASLDESLQELYESGKEVVTGSGPGVPVKFLTAKV